MMWDVKVGAWVEAWDGVSVGLVSGSKRKGRDEQRKGPVSPCRWRGCGWGSRSCGVETWRWGESLLLWCVEGMAL